MTPFSLYYISNVSDKGFDKALLPLALIISGTLGAFLAWVWHELQIKQRQYLEFCRRYIRNIEKGLEDKGGSMDYFRAESFVFFKSKTKPSPKEIGFPTADGNTIDKISILKFKYSDEKFPEDGDDSLEYHYKKVKGGMSALEQKVAWGAIFFWLIVLSVGLVLFLKDYQPFLKFLIFLKSQLILY